MALLEDIARAAIEGEALAARSLTQDWLAENERLAEIARAVAADRTVMAVAAALVELFAMRRGQAAPAWSSEVGALDEPLFLVKNAAAMPRLRRLCELEAPEPLRRRRIYAPPDYLSAA
jgi:hypothetical protein